MSERESDKGWAILELMGHRKLAGYVSDDGGLVRIDVYIEDPDSVTRNGKTILAPHATQWYGTSAIYCVTATTKDMALRVAQANQPKPVGRWELPERTTPRPDDDEPTDAELEGELQAQDYAEEWDER